MMKHVLVAKNMWNIVSSNEPRRVRANASSSDNVTYDASSSAVFMPPMEEQIQWDGHDAKAHALIALSIKKSIVPHIHSCRTAKQSWDQLASFY